jgi:hypothetical protein
MNCMSNVRLAAVCAALWAGTAGAVAVNAVSLPAQQCFLGTPTQNQIQGFSFTANVDLLVTTLGVADCNGNGLNLATPVGLYRDADQSLLAGTDIAAGTAAELDGTLRFADVAPVLLRAGMSYRILSFIEHDIGEPALLASGIVAPQITINGFLALQDGGFHPNLPDLRFIASPFCCELFGPSFRFEAAPTSAPEPSTLALVGFGLFGMAVVRRRALKSLA